MAAPGSGRPHTPPISSPLNPGAGLQPDRRPASPPLRRKLPRDGSITHKTLFQLGPAERQRYCSRLSPRQRILWEKAKREGVPPQQENEKQEYARDNYGSLSQPPDWEFSDQQPYHDEFGLDSRSRRGVRFVPEGGLRLLMAADAESRRPMARRSSQRRRWCQAILITFIFAWLIFWITVTIQNVPLCGIGFGECMDEDQDY
jgi:hypothetical protein